MADPERPATLEELPTGAKRTVKRTVTWEDNVAYCNLAGNVSRIHLDPEWASKSRLGGAVQPGLLTLAMTTGPLTQMSREAGVRAALVSVSARFRRPVKAGDTLTLEVEGWEKIPERKRIRSKLIAKNEQGEVVMEAEMIDQLV
ncbi:MAG: MaoC family dehydratase [Chloroflexi bacterium]|nr:MaoC family dehydratase [Chloroflexota bacterium]